MENILDKEFIKTILSIIIGAGISFIPNYIIEKRKEEKKFNLESIHKVLIPLGEKLEILEENIKNKEKQYKEIKYLFIDLFEIEKYLNIQNRIYLNKNLRKNLEEYLENVKNLKEILKNDYKMVEENYRIYLYTLLEKFDSSENIRILFNESLKRDILKAIIYQKNLEISSYIEKVEFIYYEEFEKKKSRTITLNNEKKSIFDHIQYCLCDESDLDQDALELFNFFKEELYPTESQKIKQLLEATQGSYYLNNLYEKIKKLKKEIIEIIDKDKI